MEMMTEPEADMVRINAAVKIWTVLKHVRSGNKLQLDLTRLVTGMTSWEYTEYRKRIA